MTANLRRGRSARDAGRWGEAGAAFEAALAAAGAERTAEVLRAEITGELGLCALHLGKHRDAAEHLARSLARREALDPPLRRRFEEGQRRADALIERVYLGVSPPDAEVLVDGKPIAGRARSYRLVLEPGQHSLRARWGGQGEVGDSFVAVAGGQRTVSLEVSRAVPVVSAPGPLAPGPRAVEPATRAAEPGTRAAEPGTRAAETRIDAPAPSAAVAPPSSSAATLRTAGVVLTGATAAAGVISLAWAFATASDLQEQSDALQRERSGYGSCAQPDAGGPCRELRDARTRLDHLAMIGWANLAASGALGAVTIASYALSDEAPAGGDGVRVAPLAAAGHVGVAVHGSW